MRTVSPWSQHFCSVGTVSPELVALMILLGSSRHDNSIEQDFESKSHLSDSFLDGQDFTHLFSYHTPSVDSLHTLTNHSTSRKLAVNFNNIPSRLLFDQTTKQCFGTYKFLRLPIGLKTAPNTFQLLMDKVSN